MKPAIQYSIEPGVGLGFIKFGCSMQDVQQYLGSPDGKEVLDPGTASTVAWWYNSQLLQITFQKPDWCSSVATDQPHRVTQVTTSHPAATLSGKKLMRQPEGDVLALFRQRGYGPFLEQSKSDHIAGYKSFRMETPRIILDFRFGLLEGVLLGSLVKES